MLLFGFLSSQENLYMIHHNSDLFNDICNTINEYNQRKNHDLPLMSLTQFDISVPVLSLFMIFIFSLFECVTHSLPLCLEDINLIAVVNRIFHISIFFIIFDIFKVQPNFIKILFY